MSKIYEETCDIDNKRRNEMSTNKWHKTQEQYM